MGHSTQGEVMSNSITPNVVLMVKGGEYNEWTRVEVFFDVAAAHTFARIFSYNESPYQYRVRRTISSNSPAHSLTHKGRSEFNDMICAKTFRANSLRSEARANGGKVYIGGRWVPCATEKPNRGKLAMPLYY
jgi:hypothetical protein